MTSGKAHSLIVRESADESTMSYDALKRLHGGEWRIRRKRKSHRGIMDLYFRLDGRCWGSFSYDHRRVIRTTHALDVNLRTANVPSLRRGSQIAVLADNRRIARASTGGDILSWSRG